MKSRTIITRLTVFLFQRQHGQLEGKTIFVSSRDLARILLTHKKSKLRYENKINTLPFEDILKKAKAIERLLAFSIEMRKSETKKTLRKRKREILLAIQHKLKVDHELSPENSAILEEEFIQAFDVSHGLTTIPVKKTRATEHAQ